MNTILQSAFLKALGWSLVDSIWQLGIVWLIYLTATRRGRKFSADKRHNLALLSLAAGSAWFLGTLCYRLAGDGEFYTGLSVASLTGSLHGFVEPTLPFLSVLYLGVTILLAGRLYRQFRLTKKLGVTGLTKAAPELRVFLKQMAMQLGIRKNVQIWISNLVETPLTIGFFKPVILLPVAIVNHLSITQTESIILHELYHIRRNDFLVNLVIAIADVFLFFNPFARFFRDVIGREREHSCDDIVVQFRYSATGYAQALLTLEQQRPSRQPVALAATGTDKFVLLARVKRVLTGEDAPAPFSQRLVAFLFSALMLGYIGLYTPGQLLLKPVFAQAEIPAAAVAFNGIEQPASFVTGKPATETVAIQPAAESKPEEIITEEPEFDDELEKSLANVIVTEKIGKLIYDAASIATSDVAYVKDEETKDYSINYEEKPAEVVVEKHLPYVPGNSFSYKVTTDEPLVIVNEEKKEIAVKGDNRLARTLSALDNINWNDVEEKLDKSGEKMNTEKLKTELLKAVARIDWKEVNKDLERSTTEATREISKYKNELNTRYQQLQKARTERLEAVKAANELEAKLKLEAAKKQIRVKKVVSI